MHKWQWFDLRWRTPILAAALIRGKANLHQLWESSYAEAYIIRPIMPQNADSQTTDNPTLCPIRPSPHTYSQTFP